MKPEISDNLSYIRVHNIYSTKDLENPSFLEEKVTIYELRDNLVDSIKNKTKKIK